MLISLQKMIPRLIPLTAPYLRIGQVFITGEELTTGLRFLLEEPGVGYSILSGSKGCSGFDLASSFNSTFSEQILADYLKNISSSAIAAAPMLLLEYASPTLADIVKHFNAMTNMRLRLKIRPVRGY